MFRVFANSLRSTTSAVLRTNTKTVLAAPAVRMSHGSTETDAQLDARYEAFFNRPDIDGWELRKAINDLQGLDMVAEPKIAIACLKACRRNNDYALAVRFLESLQWKCGPHLNKIWPYMLSELQPTLTELGISTPEEMGYDHPELALQSVYDIH